MEYPDEWKREFAEKITAHKGFIISRLRKKYPVLMQKHGFDDYYQEVCINAYKLFHRFKEREYEDFARWLFQVIKYAVLNYAHEQIRYLNKNWHTDKNFIYDVPAEVYQESEVMDEMMKAVDDLDEKDRMIVDMVLQGEDLSKNSLDAGLSKGNYVKRFELAKRKIHAIVRQRLSVSVKERVFNTAGRGSGLLQIDPKSGDSKEWPTMLAAVREGWSAHQILRVLKGQQETYNGWIWKRPEEKKIA